MSSPSFGAASQLTNFGRQFSITIQTQDGTTYTLNSSPDIGVRVEFDIELVALMVYQRATLKIYNLNTTTQSQILSSAPSQSTILNFLKYGQPVDAGTLVTISAGYTYGLSGAFNAQSSQIYQGNVLQAIWLRPGVVDSVLELRCVNGIATDALNFVNFGMAKGGNDYQAVKQIAHNSNISPLDIDDGAQAAMSAQTYPGSQAFGTRPFEILRGIGNQNKLLSWIDADGLHMRSFSGTLAPPTLAYGPPPQPNAPSNSQTPSTIQGVTVQPTLLGTPAQTNDGILFRVLLDSQPKIGTVVALTPNVLVNAAQYNLGGSSLQPVPSQSGTYVIAGLRFFGDSRGRGDDWYTEIQGLVQDYFTNFDKAAPPN
jgi:hypothetical protein